MRSEDEELDTKLAELEALAIQQVAKIKELRGVEPSKSRPEPEDSRLAAQLASESAKSLLQIAVATFVVAAGFLQFLISRGVQLASLPAGLVGAGLFLTAISMVFGFLAMSGLYRRGEGTLPSNEPWSTRNVRREIDVQAWAGILSLLAILGGVVASSGHLSD